ncbi:MAG: hypothetical protein MJZ17_07805 [Bacteroidales bacterium]|nr:hypothetical protein [Bacteroidales bacterium]
MKKILVLFAAAVLLAAPAANAQSLLGRLGNAVSKKVSEKISEKVTEKVTEKVNDKIEEKTGINVDNMKQMSEASQMPVPDSKETLQPRRSSSFGWSGAVTPSTASFPIPLMNEFPAVPSASQLANPTEEAQIAYYQAVKAVTLRAEELNADTTCEDNFTEKWRAEAEKALQDAYGITAAEMEALKNGTLSEAEEEALTARMRAKILGGIDENQLLEEAKKSENMTEDQFQDIAVTASDRVFDKYDAQLRKYFGCTAEEYKQATRASMASEDNAASRAIEKKTDAYIKTLSPEEQKEAKAFKNALQKELMQAAMGSVPGADLGMQIAKNVQNFQNQLSPLLEKYQKLQKYAQDVAAAWPQGTWSDADAKFSEAERRKIENILNQIAATDDPKVYDPLYLQAMEIIKTYRERAAKVWAADVQGRFDKVKNGMGDIIKIQRQAVAEGIIPECALWRVPLNLVVEAGDVLAEAYSDFPSNYPDMYIKETVRQLIIGEGESAWWPEFYVSSDLVSVLEGRNMFKESNGKVYQFNKGSWNLVPDNFEEQAAPAEKAPQSASWTSMDGKRTATFNAEGGFITLPEGDVIYPVAWEKQGRYIVWAEVESAQMQDNSVQYRIIKCTYKL